MKKRVFSILLALALCLTLLPAAAWAEETGTNGDETCTHADWKYIDDEEGQRHIQQCKNCPQKITPTDCIHREGTTKGKCEICGLDLAVSLNDWTGGRCVTTWEKAFSHVGSSKYYPITDITENVTLNNANGEPLKIHMAGYKATGKITVQSGTLELYLNPAEDRDMFASTISEIEVNGGTLNVTGNELLTIEKLTVTGGTVQLSGGTYGTITPPAGKSVNDLLALGYYAVQTANGISVQQAPITNVTVSVSNNDNTVYGYSEADAPVLTATVTPSDLQGVTYQWYKVNGSEKTAIDNATAQTYTVETGLNAGDYDYCCTATVGTYSLTSDDVTVTIKKADGPQLGTINVNQVYNDTASKTINIYDYIGTDLNKLAKDAGTLRFHTGTYSPVDTIKSGWGVDVNTGAITYQLANGLSVNDEITITMQVGYDDQTYSKNHEDATVTVNITLTKITPTGTPNYTPITSSGKTLADAHLNANNNAFSVPGAVEWVLEGNQTPEDVTVVKGARYAWKFTPDEDNSAIYEGLTGTIIPWTESGSGAVIITPSQSGESTPASNPNTGAAHVGQPLPGLALLALAALCLYAGTRRF